MDRPMDRPLFFFEIHLLTDLSTTYVDQWTAQWTARGDPVQDRPTDRPTNGPTGVTLSGPPLEGSWPPAGPGGRPHLRGEVR